MSYNALNIHSFALTYPVRYLSFVLAVIAIHSCTLLTYCKQATKKKCCFFPASKSRLQTSRQECSLIIMWTMRFNIKTLVIVQAACSRTACTLFVCACMIFYVNSACLWLWTFMLQWRSQSLLFLFLCLVSSRCHAPFEVSGCLSLTVPSRLAMAAEMRQTPHDP